MIFLLVQRLQDDSRASGVIYDTNKADTGHEGNIGEPEG